MKRMLFVISMLCIATIVSAQTTYYYKYVKTVDKDGVASNNGSSGSYITFTNSVMYYSDAEGARTNTDPYSTYFYRGEINGCYWYMQKYKGYNWGHRWGEPLFVENWNEGEYCLVSKDFSTINFVYDGTKAFTSNGVYIKSDARNTFIYSRSSAPKLGDDIPGLIK